MKRHHTAAALAACLWSSPVWAGAAQDWKTSLIQGCWACKFVNKLSDIGLAVADQIFSSLAHDLATLLGLLMALWILFFAGQMLLPFGPDGHGGWNQGAKKLFHLAVVLTFLQGSQLFWDYVFIPVMSTGIGLASNIMTISGPFEGAEGTSENLGGDDANDYCASTSSTATGLSAAKGVLTSINCPLSKIQSQFGKGMLLGVAVLSGSSCTLSASLAPGFSASSNPYSFGFPMNVLDLFFSGLIIILIYFAGYILFPILLMDVLTRTIVVAAISPLAIGASLFKSTHRIMDKALWNLVHAGLTLVFAAVIGGIGKATLAYVFSTLLPTNGQPLSDWQSLVAALENPCQSGLYIDVTTSSFYMMCGVGIMLIFMLREAGHMAAEFSGASGGDFSGAKKGVGHMTGAAGWTLGRLVGAKRGGARSLATKVSGNNDENAD